MNYDELLKYVGKSVQIIYLRGIPPKKRKVEGKIVAISENFIQLEYINCYQELSKKWILKPKRKDITPLIKEK